MVYQKVILPKKIGFRVKTLVGKTEKYSTSKSQSQKSGTVILTSDKIELQLKKVIRYKMVENQYIYISQLLKN